MSDTPVRQDLPAPLRWLHAFDTFVAKLEAGAIVLLLGSMIVLAFVQVALRNLFDTGLSWSDVFTRNEVLWAAFIGASLATRERRHVGIDILGRLLPARLRYLHRAALDYVAMFVCGVLAYAAWGFLQTIAPEDGVAHGELAAWAARFVVPGGFAMMALRFGLHAITDTYDFFAGNVLESLVPHEVAAMHADEISEVSDRRLAEESQGTDPAPAADDDDGASDDTSGTAS